MIKSTQGCGFMTVGKRIQKFRKLAGYSGAELSLNTGISHTVLRKYETDRSKPKEEQIQIIGDALNVSPYSIIGNTYIHHIKTLGDLFGIIISLYNSNLIVFDGIRDSAGKLIPPISCSINEQISNFIDFQNSATIDINKLFISNKILSDFLNWEMYNDRLNSYVSRYKTEHFQDKEYINTVKDFTDLITEFEIKLMYIQNILNEV